MNGFMMCLLLAATGQAGDAAERDFGWQINPDDGKLEYIVQLSPDEANFMVSATKEHASDVPPEVAARLSRVVVRIGTEPLVSTPMEEVLKLPPVTTAVLANIEAAAGRGRFSQLESSPPGEVRNVSGDKSPPPLSSSPGTALPNAGTSFAEQARELRSNLNDAVKSGLGDTISSRGADALRGAENLLAQNLSQNSAGGSFLNDSRGISAGTGKFSSTGTPTSSPSSAATPLPGSPSGTAGSTAGGTYPTSPTHQHAPGDGYHNDGTVAAPPMNSTIGGGLSGGGLGNSSYPASGSGLSGANTAGSANPPYNGNAGSYGSGSQQGYSGGQGYSGQGYSGQGYGGQAPGMTPMNGGNIAGGNFGGMPRGAQVPPAYNQYATTGTNSGLGTQPYYGQPGYPAGTVPPAYSGVSTGFPSDPLSLPSGSQQPVRMADNRGSISVPSTSGSGSGSASGNHSATSTKSGKGNATSTSNDDDVAEAYPNGRSGVENVLPVMFVLSLVVNFYLGMLIRKLLTRYRSLLSSVRSQAV